MDQDKIQRLIEGNSQLPTLLNFYAKFREKISDPTIPAGEIASLISSDAVVSSNVLRTANSSFYGLMNRITTISHAIVIIGFSGVHFIVLNTAVLNIFKEGLSDDPAFHLRRLWRHSLAVAKLSRIIAKKVHYVAFEEMFTAGLLHDIGKVFIFKHFPDDFLAITAKASLEKMLIRDAEEAVLGYTHMHIGGVLLRGWNLPQTLVETTQYHHEPALAKDKSKASSIVHLANVLAHALEIGSSAVDKIEPINADAWAQLGLQERAIEEIVEDMKAESDTKDDIGDN